MGKDTLHDRQLASKKSHLLPEHDKEACKPILSSSKFTILDNMLYHIESHKTLTVVVPETDRKVLFDEGMFGGHLREAKIHGQQS